MGYWSVERQRIGHKGWRLAVGMSAVLVVVLALALIPIRNSMARTVRAQAARAIQLHPDLAAEIGDHPQFGFIWRMYERSDTSGGRLAAYVPVTGSRSGGTLYIEDWNGELRTVRYRPDGGPAWKDY